MSHPYPSYPVRAWAEIDLSALQSNIASLRQFLGNRALLAMVKANAYGHGAVPVAEAALAAGVKFLGVANVAEGIELREAGVHAPVVVLGSLLPDEVVPAIRNGLQIVLAPVEILRDVQAASRELGCRAQVHIMVDTGMARHGVAPEQAIALAQAIATDPWMDLVGLATHFVASDREETTLSERQIDMFQQVVTALKARDIHPPYIHAANTGAILRLPGSYFNLARPGAAIYGFYPSPSLAPLIDLAPVMSVRARITLLRDVTKGTSVGYGGTARTSSDTRIAVVPVGYADGWPVALSGQGYVLVRGCRAALVGRIMMDCMIADVGHIPGVRAGDTATLLGRDGTACIRVEELGKLSGRIPYEVTCGIGRRILPCYASQPCAPSSESAACRERAASPRSSASLSPSA